MDWTSWKGATCLPHCWCEAARVGNWILEPVNTWTNLAFIFAGIYFFIHAKAYTDHSNTLNSHIVLPRIYAFALIFVGAGSFFYHASQTFIGQWFDVFGMYLIAVFYICYNWLRTNKLKLKQFFTVYLLISLFLGFVVWYIPSIRRELFGLAIAFALFQSIFIQKKSQTQINGKYLLLALACYISAQTVWVLDKEGIWCDPYGLINGHGIWHILCAGAAISIYSYFRSEKNLA